uniref:Ranakinin n=1 Tax=Pelophylax ridibundus TaxID=8406 RepID=TKNA_PELRI|nr:RecName: Full=Ranakinin; AltName: Full=Substance-P-related peptide [Pelophylax ridibundus]AAB20308.1 ranakinin=neurokinin B-related peptide [Rana ridibunda=frogs, brain, Peptide, 11 aa] [Pelophylax ridibundus]
KPNPERFYGLM